MCNNVCYPLFEQRNKTLSGWGKDTTGKINYSINNQGFRNQKNYDFIPKYAFFGSSSLFGIGVDEKDILVSYFPDSQNYGLAGDYLNIHSIENLENFLKSSIYRPEVKTVFFWVERDNENIIELSARIRKMSPATLQISQGKKYINLINLIPQVDSDVSGTHPGPKTHKIWAKSIKLLFKNDQ